MICEQQVMYSRAKAMADSALSRMEGLPVSIASLGLLYCKVLMPAIPDPTCHPIVAVLPPTLVTHTHIITPSHSPPLLPFSSCHPPLLLLERRGGGSGWQRSEPDRHGAIAPHTHRGQRHRATTGNEQTTDRH